MVSKRLAVPVNLLVRLTSSYQTFIRMWIKTAKFLHSLNLSFTLSKAIAI